MYEQSTETPFEPQVEHFQTPIDVIVIAHLPGVVKDEVKIQCDETSLTIKIIGPSDPRQIARMGYYSHEVTKMYGYSKTINFSCKVNPTSVKATFKNGALEVRIPRK